MSLKQVKSALISVFYKDGLEPLVRHLHENNVVIYSTGGTEAFITQLGIPCVAVESVTGFPSILGGRVKTLHPKMFGGILSRRELPEDQADCAEYGIPEIDLVIVDLYPFEETLKSTQDQKLIIEKIDIGGPSMLRAAAKNFKDVISIGSFDDYNVLLEILKNQNNSTTIEQRQAFAAKVFNIVMNYDIAINNYFNSTIILPLKSEKSLRYGENPHQNAVFYGDLSEIMTQLNGKELSYNNLVDVDAAVQMLAEVANHAPTCGIIKHTNICGFATQDTVLDSWNAALSGDPESAFGGVIFFNSEVDESTAEAINDIFFEVVIAPAFTDTAVSILSSKKNRIVLKYNQLPAQSKSFKNILNGTLVQDIDTGSHEKWDVVGGELNDSLKADLEFAQIAVKHLKSNAIALVKNKTLIGKGCGQTSRIDALKQSIDKARSFNHDVSGAVMASDAFFPFNDCVQLVHEAGVVAVIQPGGSIRDKDSIEYCEKHQLPMVMTGMRHFKH